MGALAWRSESLVSSSQTRTLEDIGSVDSHLLQYVTFYVCRSGMSAAATRLQTRSSERPALGIYQVSK